MAETAKNPRIVEDGSAVTVVVDKLGEDTAEVHVIDMSQPGASERIDELHGRASEDTLVMGFFGHRAVFEDPADDEPSQRVADLLSEVAAVDRAVGMPGPNEPLELPELPQEDSFGEDALADTDLFPGGLGDIFNGNP